MKKFNNGNIDSMYDYCFDQICYLPKTFFLTERIRALRSLWGVADSVVNNVLRPPIHFISNTFEAITKLLSFSLT